jgi:GntR family transcriptional regulator/MocR family aminotransferase
LGYLVLPAELVPAFRQAKRLTDRHASVWDQRALASLIDSGAYERHVRRIRREHERRRAALLGAVSRHLPGDARVIGAAAGLHVVLWLPSLRPQYEPALVAAARDRSVGVHGVSSLFATPGARHSPRPAGLTLGYAALTVEQIEQGIQGLARAMEALRSAR